MGLELERCRHVIHGMEGYAGWIWEWLPKAICSMSVWGFAILNFFEI